MSTFITGGHYTADENIIFGEGFAEDGTVELVRMDLVNNGPFADVDSYTVLEKGFAPAMSPCMVRMYFLSTLRMEESTRSRRMAASS